jgi:phosphatidylserine decarboxylase
MNALTFATAQIIRVLPRAQISRVMGHLADTKWSPRVGRAVVKAYCRAYDVHLDECTRSEFHNFDAFFTRTLKDGARPLDTHAVLTSPADGRVESMGPVDRNRTFTVKGRPYSVEELVGSASEARRYEGGLGCVVYLSPRDYHRVHAPVSGTISHITSLPGDYYPVNSIGLRHVPNLFARNRRVAIAIDSDQGLGRVTVVMVAAMIVGRITTVGVDARDVPFGEHHPAVQVQQGDEIGIFHLGSTAVVFVEERAHGRFNVEPGPIRMGQALVVPGAAFGATGATAESTNGEAAR